MNDCMLVDIHKAHLRAAIMHGSELDDLFLVAIDEEAPVGAIFLGRVRRVLPGINGAFVDLGTATDGFLRASAARGAAAPGSPADDRSIGEDRPRIGDYVTEGQAVAVQVARPGIAGKGPVLTTELTLAGRYLVFRAADPALSISRRIDDEGKRQELAALVEPLLDGANGFVVRTLAAGATAAALRGEAERLRSRWAAIEQGLRTVTAPTRVDDGGAPLLRVLREAELASDAVIRTQGVAGMAELMPEIEGMWPDLGGRVEIDNRPESLFEAAGVNDALAPYLGRHVDLPGGGSLAVEPTQALTAIDVDTGTRSADRGNPVLTANLDAAAEIARQLRIRNLGGLVVVDFVHMRHRDDRDRVVAALRSALDDDRSRVQVLGISPLGLVEMSRERNAYAALTEAMTPE
ncbi:MAG: ribonuclease E [Alphaproteobacteria bacterium]|nr:ribonuclease E [Alphaproteobacteria bacterium]